MVLAEDDGRNNEEVEEEENKAKAVIAAKTGNLSVSVRKRVGRHQRPTTIPSCGRLVQNTVRSAYGGDTSPPELILFPPVR